eukprot:g8530.t1
MLVGVEGQSISATLRRKMLWPRTMQKDTHQGVVAWFVHHHLVPLSLQETKWKAVGQESHQGFLIEAMVDPGHVKKMPWN